MTSEIETIAIQYRAALDAMDNSTLEALTAEWLKVEQGLQRDINALAAEIARREAAGEVVTQQMLWDMGSYRRTMANMENLIDQYRIDASGIIARAQYDAGWLGVLNANDVISANFYANGLAPEFWERLNVEAVENMMATLNNQTPWVQKLTAIYGADVAALQSAMIEGIARGYGDRKMAEMMRDALSIGLNKSLLIAETEMGRAYRYATVQQYQESGVVVGYKRLVKKETACLACLLLDGEYYEVESQMEDHPRGFCDTIAVVAGVGAPAWELGSDWLLHQDPERMQEIMGDARYQLWQDGIKLQDLIYKRDDPYYGLQPAIKALKDL